MCVEWSAVNISERLACYIIVLHITIYGKQSSMQAKKSAIHEIACSRINKWH